MKSEGEILKSLSSKTPQNYWIELRETPKDLFSKDIYYKLCELLSSSNKQVVFFSLYFLIDKCDNYLRTATQNTLEQIYSLLFSKNGPIIDRTIWALGIIGERAFNKVKKEYLNGDLELKKQLTFVISRIGILSVDRIQLLISGTESKDKELIFRSLNELLQYLSIGNFGRYKSDDIDYDLIYLRVLPILEKFISSKDKSERDFAIDYTFRIKSILGKK